MADGAGARAGRAAGIRRVDCYSTLVAESFYRSVGLRTVEPISVAMPARDLGGEVVDFPSLLMRIEL